MPKTASVKGTQAYLEEAPVVRRVLGPRHAADQPLQVVADNLNRHAAASVCVVRVYKVCVCGCWRAYLRSVKHLRMCAHKGGSCRCLEHPRSVAPSCGPWAPSPGLVIVDLTQLLLDAPKVHHGCCWLLRAAAGWIESTPGAAALLLLLFRRCLVPPLAPLRAPA